MNITVERMQGRLFQHVAWKMGNTQLERRIQMAIHGTRTTITFNVTHEEYHALVNKLRSDDESLLSSDSIREMLRALNEYALPILVEEALGATA